MEPAGDPVRAGLGEQSPEDLACAAQGGSMPSFAELVARFEARVFNFLLRRTGSRADAEDLTQETLVRAWQRIALYKPRWRFSTWLFTIAARVAASHGRSAQRRRGLHASLRDSGGGSPSAEPDPSVAAGASEQARRLWQVAARVLSEEQQVALWLRYSENMAIKQIAAVLGRTQVAVRVSLFRARGVLAEHLPRPGAERLGRLDGTVVGRGVAVGGERGAGSEGGVTGARVSGGVPC